MKIEWQAEHSRIFETIISSHMYGTALPTSDIDKAFWLYIKRVTHETQLN